MIKVDISVLEYEVMFCFDRDMFSLKVLDDNSVRVGKAIHANNHKSHYFVVLADNIKIKSGHKEYLRRNYSLFLIITKKALKYFKKNHPERYEEVKANIKTLSDNILN